jgi:hypothetical protein
MARQSPEPHVILTVLLHRVLGVAQPETAKQLGYKNTKSISALIERYKLDDIESQIRMAIIGQASSLPPEAQAVNADFDKKLAEISDRIIKELDSLLALGPDEVTDLERMKLLQTAVKTAEDARQARLKIACATAENRKKDEQAADNVASEYEDLLGD